MSSFPGIADWSGLTIVDAQGRYVIPSWCDSHTHSVFAKDRSEEFLLRLEGATYQEIAARGGGILNSAKALQSMSEDELFEAPWPDSRRHSPGCGCVGDQIRLWLDLRGGAQDAPCGGQVEGSVAHPGEGHVPGMPCSALVPDAMAYTQRGERHAPR